MHGRFLVMKLVASYKNTVSLVVVALLMLSSQNLLLASDLGSFLAKTLDSGLYETMAYSQISSLEDLADDYSSYQETYVPVLLPDPDSTL
jgi:hypothetical protein